MFQRIQVFTQFLDGIVPVDEAPPMEWENIYLNLAFRCQNLFHLLVPPELVQRAAQWAAGSTLVISSNEGWIPWEAFHDGSEYWGTRLILGRYPRMTAPGQAPAKDRPKAGPLEIRWITHVIGGRLAPATLDQARKLFADQPGVTVKPLIERSLADLVGVLPQTDLLHLTCHGGNETPMLAIAKGETDYMNLNLDIVGNLPVKPGSFIFANACYSNSAVSQFRILTSFGWEFYKDGAGIYIGTLARVPEVYAMEFAREFYRRMFSAGDRTVGQVLYELKKELAGRRNLHWLMYSMYGDPNQTFAARPGSGE